MTPRLRFRPQARTEALEARDWYEARHSGLGSAFAEVLDAVFDAVLDRPEAFPKVRGDIRHAVVRRFPYSVLFTYDGTTVLILNVHHHRRDPRRWQNVSG
jgi:plasmid stabilization system protein ParE